MINEFIITATRSMRSYASRVAEFLVKFPSFSSFADTINGVDVLGVDRFADGKWK
jgi:hypothetical protein